MKGKDNLVPMLDSESRLDSPPNYKLQQFMDVSGQFHTPAAFPPGKSSRALHQVWAP